MEEQVKICPQCGAEYFAHVKECRSCEVPLLTPEEAARQKEVPKAEGAFVCVEEGDYDIITRLASALEASGIDNHILRMKKDNSCSGGCGGDFGIFVKQSLVRTAIDKLQFIWDKMNPEVREAEQKIEAGMCPACGSDMKGAAVCPDCGLNLGGTHDDGCGGGCGPC